MGSLMNKNSGGKVVIVDDELDIRTSLRELIENSGFEAYDFENGYDALVFLHEQHADVDVLLTDLQMPEMGGMELLDLVLATDFEIPVILMTAFAEIDLTVAAIKKGAFDFIIKPFDPEYMLKAIEKGVTYRRLRTLEKNYLENLKKALEEQACKLKMANEIVLQNEKMALVGHIAAGVVHEINNPVGFISSNMESLRKYTARLLEFLDVLTESHGRYCPPEEFERIEALKKKIHFKTIEHDIPELLEESQEGVERIKEIVRNLKGFSHVDDGVFVSASINEVIDKALKIAKNEFKYIATIVTDFGDVPLIQCLPNQLTQVVMNLLINAAHAIEDQGEIFIKSWFEGDSIYVTIRDSGCGIPGDIKKHIFEPFFTTKEPGKGTGLGLSISYDIILKHTGEISVESTLGSGTTFKIRLPVVS